MKDLNAVVFICNLTFVMSRRISSKGEQNRTDLIRVERSRKSHSGTETDRKSARQEKKMREFGAETKEGTIVVEEDRTESCDDTLDGLEDVRSAGSSSANPKVPEQRKRSGSGRRRSCQGEDLTAEKRGAGESIEGELRGVCKQEREAGGAEVTNSGGRRRKVKSDGSGRRTNCGQDGSGDQEQDRSLHHNNNPRFKSVNHNCQNPLHLINTIIYTFNRQKKFSRQTRRSSLLVLELEALRQEFQQILQQKETLLQENSLYRSATFRRLKHRGVICEKI